ncbi:MAG: 2Fe-2S iron-sulfur cluster-binding protein, partial [Candidatus Latescibacterota bacterium]
MRELPQTVTFRVDFPEAGRTSIVGPGTTILAAAQRAGVHIDCFCGGDGHCGKCRVMVEDGRVRMRTNSSPESVEVEKGFVLACRAEVLSDVRVKTPKENRIDDKILLAEFQTKDFGPASSWYSRKPLCRKQYLELAPPSLTDSLSDFERVQQALSSTVGTPVYADLGCIRTIPDALRESGFRITATYACRDNAYEILRLQGGNVSRENFGMAVDIGTTTVMANLVDLNSGKICASSAVYNSQMRYGADVITRIMYTQENRDGLESLQNLIVQDINKLVGRLTVQTEIHAEDITSLVCSGNTIMIHFLLGINPGNIRKEPY